MHIRRILLPGLATCSLRSLCTCVPVYMCTLPSSSSMNVNSLGWRFGIRTDSGEFRAAPQGILLRSLTVCMGMSTLQKRVPDSDGFGRESDSDGFGRIPRPQKWKSATQSSSMNGTSVITTHLDP